MNSTLFDIQTLFDSNLVEDHFQSAALTELSVPTHQWLDHGISKGYFSQKDFYKKLAKLYKNKYWDSINLNINPSKNVAMRVPTHLMNELKTVPVEAGNGTLYFASANPFISNEDAQELLEYTGFKEFKFVQTNPFAVNDAIKNIHYLEFGTVAEGSLRVRQNELSASPPVVLKLTRALVAIAVVLMAGFFFLPRGYTLAAFFVVNVFYLYLNYIRFLTFYKALKHKKEVNIMVSEEELAELNDSSLPRYTVIVPLRFERPIVPHLVESLKKLDYPKNKLEIFFVIGVDDTETAQALEEQGINARSDSINTLDTYMHLIKVPKMNVDTKPLVCNYALRFATGAYTVIYDAEDAPEPTQLKKAVIGYQKSSLDTVCLQAKLGFYNSHKNLLTRFFTLEYGMWFDYFLPGLQSIKSPVPLGGTSNHFVTKVLTQTGEWDPYNVTEDADLGMRIYRHRYRTKILDSYTMEEASSKLGVWLKQRSRWEKGFLATLLVHLRHPVKLRRELGAKQFWLGVTIFFGNFYMPFINPMLWLITILWLLSLFSIGTISWYIWVPALLNLIVGNIVHMAMHFMAAFRTKRRDLSLLALLIPFYWALISLATYIASYEIFRDPYKWNKTSHGSE